MPAHELRAQPRPREFLDSHSSRLAGYLLNYHKITCLACNRLGQLFDSHCPGMTSPTCPVKVMRVMREYWPSSCMNSAWLDLKKTCSIPRNFYSPCRLIDHLTTIPYPVATKDCANVALFRHLFCLIDTNS